MGKRRVQKKGGEQWNQPSSQTKENDYLRIVEKVAEHFGLDNPARTSEYWTDLQEQAPLTPGILLCGAPSSKEVPVKYNFNPGAPEFVPKRSPSVSADHFYFNIGPLTTCQRGGNVKKSPVLNPEAAEFKPNRAVGGPSPATFAVTMSSSQKDLIASEDSGLSQDFMDCQSNLVSIQPQPDYSLSAPVQNHEENSDSDEELSRLQELFYVPKQTAVEPVLSTSEDVVSVSSNVAKCSCCHDDLKFIEKTYECLAGHLFCEACGNERILFHNRKCSAELNPEDHTETGNYFAICSEYIHPEESQEDNSFDDDEVKEYFFNETDCPVAGCFRKIRSIFILDHLKNSHYFETVGGSHVATWRLSSAVCIDRPVFEGKLSFEKLVKFQNHPFLFCMEHFGQANEETVGIWLRYIPSDNAIKRANSSSFFYQVSVMRNDGLSKITFCKECVRWNKPSNIVFKQDDCLKLPLKDVYEKYLVECEDANKVASLPVNFQVCVICPKVCSQFYSNPRLDDKSNECAKEANYDPDAKSESNSVTDVDDNIINCRSGYSAPPGFEMDGSRVYDSDDSWSQDSSDSDDSTYQYSDGSVASNYQDSGASDNSGNEDSDTSDNSTKDDSGESENSAYEDSDASDNSNSTNEDSDDSLTGAVAQSDADAFPDHRVDSAIRNEIVVPIYFEVTRLSLPDYSGHWHRSDRIPIQIHDNSSDEEVDAVPYSSSDEDWQSPGRLRNAGHTPYNRSPSKSPILIPEELINHSS